MQRRIVYGSSLACILVLVFATAWYGGCRRTQSGKQQVKVGVVLPLTGATARYGKWIRNALELALEQHNTDATSKYEISYVLEDDSSETGKAVSATQKLIAVDRVPAIFGTWSSAGVLAMAPLVQTNKVVLMADAVSPRIRDAGDWVFRCVPDARLSLEVLQEPLRASGKQRLAIVYINNDFGKDLADYMEKLVGQGPPSVVLKEGYAAGTSDFRTLIEKLKVANADAVFIAGYVEQGTLVRQMKELGLSAKIYASPSFENDDILKQAGTAAEGIVFPSYFDPNSEIEPMRRFLAMYKNKYGEAAEGFGATGFAGMGTLFNAIERCQPTVSAECIRQGLNSMGTFQTVFGSTSVDDVGDLRYPIFVKTVANGTFVRKTG